MNGINKITARILAESESQAQAILERADAQAAEIVSGVKMASESEYRDAVAEGKKAAGERRERLAGSAQSEAKKLVLASKQKMLDKAYELALDKLCDYPNKTEFLASLAFEAAVTGDEKIVMNPSDHDFIGEKVTTLANEKLIAAGKAGKLTLSDETRDIRGGFYLSGGSIETNCTFEALIKAEREEGAAEAAKVLFQ